MNLEIRESFLIRIGAPTRLLRRGPPMVCYKAVFRDLL